MLVGVRDSTIPSTYSIPFLIIIIIIITLKVMMVMLMIANIWCANCEAKLRKRALVSFAELSGAVC